MDLSKAFDCIPDELLIAKMDAYGFSENALTFFFSYLKRRKQSVQINNIYSIFQLLLSVVPQGSILGPILFNLFINDLLMYIKNTDLHNFADDNRISCVSSSLNELISELGKEGSIASSVKWTVLAHLESQPRGQNFQTQNLVDRSSPPYTRPNENTNKHI